MAVSCVKVTVCEFSHEPHELEAAWLGLCAHVGRERSDLIVLPEVAFCRPLWLSERFDPGLWSEAVAVHDQWLGRLRELGASFVVGTRPVTLGSSHFNTNSPGGRGATTGGEPNAWADSIREVVLFFGQHLGQP